MSGNNDWLDLSEPWRKALVAALSSCGINDDLDDFQRMVGSRSLEIVDTKTGKEGYVIFGLEFENPTHKTERDTEMKAVTPWYNGHGITVCPFESQDRRFSGFKLEVLR
ncbi:MAG: hypothetical protein KKD18_00660 [Nanoarchaeota archaeon]|nr:hypothetical protein [Nanoarchaeota archaeon]MBU0976908.1 hypothetical protein [Nanoarchaeota archaeon]